MFDETLGIRLAALEADGLLVLLRTIPLYASILVAMSTNSPFCFRNWLNAVLENRHAMSDSLRTHVDAFFFSVAVTVHSLLLVPLSSNDGLKDTLLEARLDSIWCQLPEGSLR